MSYFFSNSGTSYAGCKDDSPRDLIILKVVLQWVSMEWRPQSVVSIVMLGTDRQGGAALRIVCGGGSLSLSIVREGHPPNTQKLAAGTLTASHRNNDHRISTNDFTFCYQATSPR